jgi:hypothetical protein
MNKTETPHQLAIDRILDFVETVVDIGDAEQTIRTELEAAFKRGYEAAIKNYGLTYKEDMGR